MIKVALKHWIYEICLEQLFNGISESFKIGDRSPVFNVGDRFDYLTVYEGSADPCIRYSTFFNAHITYIYKTGAFSIKGVNRGVSYEYLNEHKKLLSCYGGDYERIVGKGLLVDFRRI